ncbi:hypothetical protein BD779DRAFT_1749144 [Infundibulicybe gibba]|nr:hypothetical protein BD779DRAFT_1749144 [Infundibulicybe gibba]
MAYAGNMSYEPTPWDGGAPKSAYLDYENRFSGATIYDPNTQAACCPRVNGQHPCARLGPPNVLLHLLCLGIGITRVEHRVVIPLGHRSNFLSTLLVQVLQIFTTLYTAAVLFLTQQLAICRNLLVKQKLTATHDKAGAWNGLGSAVLAVWRQFSLTTSVGGTIAIATYLGGIAVLHITTPTLLALTTFNVTEYIDVGKQFPTPDASQIVNIFNDLTWQDQSQALPFLERIDGISKIGVYNGTLYEVLDTNEGIGNVTVNAMTFNITCGHLINSQDQPSPNAFSTSSLDMIPTKLAPNTLKSLPDQIAMSRFFVSTTNITDSNGDTGPLYILKPPIKPPVGLVITTQAEADASTVYTLQFISCIAAVINSTVTVDAQSKMILTPPKEKTKSEWWQWVPSKEAGGPKLAFLSRWRQLFSLSASSRYPVFACDNQNTSGCDTLSTPDQFLAQNLHLYPDVNPSTRREPYPNITLHQLENSLASLSAMAYWATTNVGRSGLIRSGVSSSTGTNWTQLTEISPTRAGTVPVKHVRLSARLNIDPGAGDYWAVGVKYPPLGFHRTSMAIECTSRGDVADFTADVPSVDELRRAGMFEAQLDGSSGAQGAGW